MFLATEGSEHLRLRRDAIPWRQVSTGRGPTPGHLLKDAGIGVAAGVLGALAIQFAKDRNGGDCGTTSSRAWCGGTGIANGVFLGGVAGLFVGLRFPGEQWREVWIR